VEALGTPSRQKAVQRERGEMLGTPSPALGSASSLLQGLCTGPTLGSPIRVTPAESHTRHHPLQLTSTCSKSSRLPYI
jgi:hypothetical protein